MYKLSFAKRANEDIIRLTIKIRLQVGILG